MDTSPLFRHIMAGIDTDGLAIPAVLQAVDLAKAFDAKLDLVHALDIPAALWPGVGGAEIADMHANSLDHARAKATSALTPALRAAHPEILADDITSVYPGQVGRVLLQQMDELNADLLVLGTHAKRSPFDIGSTARNVFSRSKIPVWIQPSPVTPIKRILVPVDFSEHSQSAMEHAHALAVQFGASVQLLHCYEAPSFAYAEPSSPMPYPSYAIDHQRDAARGSLETCEAEFPWGSVPHTSTFQEAAPADATLKAGEQADLIVMGTHGRTGLSRFLTGSVAHAIIKRSKMPVLLVPKPSGTFVL
ncbi:MAG: nucleotide-binding universal stress UspA family protein [Planctomycetota bacterium]|jgi:nucleotide-binding universal stress UspA family protein